MQIDARGKSYRQLNEEIHSAIAAGESRIEVSNVLGHRYIGTGVDVPAEILLEGTPGNDLAAFMNGPDITVKGNAQDATGNTMSGGRVVIHGSAGDLLAHSMRGGTILVRGRAGYRVGIHMKAFGSQVARVVVGGVVGDYAAEYMAGGVLVVLGLDIEKDQPLAGRLLGTGMHGGEIFLRGDVADHQLGKEVGRVEIDDDSWNRLALLLKEFGEVFGCQQMPTRKEFTRLVPTTHRPYGQLYVY